MKILIPPSEGKSSKNTTSIKFKDTNSKFRDAINHLIIKLGEHKPLDLQKIYGVTSEKSVKLHEQNLNLFESECSKAIERYTGVVYNNLSPESLDHKANKFLEENFLITSALLGLISPNDLIPAYKLKMNVLRLHDYWNPLFTDHLSKEDLIIDLLPEVHRKSYHSKNIFKINFYFEKNGKLVSSGHNGKAIKGRYLKYIVENQIDNLDGFKSFNEDGFKWQDNGFIKKV
ncbi:MAG: YaaA family protein [Chloroflexota bacterium]|nr:YaaA family protein [Chloroflexota bacterium]